jgi:hypothetical protein
MRRASVAWASKLLGAVNWSISLYKNDGSLQNMWLEERRTASIRLLSRSKDFKEIDDSLYSWLLMFLNSMDPRSTDENKSSSAAQYKEATEC